MEIQNLVRDLPEKVVHQRDPCLSRYPKSLSIVTNIFHQQKKKK